MSWGVRVCNVYLERRERAREAHELRDALGGRRILRVESQQPFALVDERLEGCGDLVVALDGGEEQRLHCLLLRIREQREPAPPQQARASTAREPPQRA